ncbi:MAG: DUF6261 family protein [Petrimonas sp.]|nr:DUF6261 family protein [Petrimonas sp.]
MLLNTFTFYRLRKLEFADYVKGVINIVRKYDAGALNIGAMVALLLEQEPQVDKLIVGYGRHPLTNEINKLREKRNNFLTAVQSHLVSVETAAMETSAAHLNLVTPFLRRMLYDIKSVNEKERTERIRQLFSTTESNIPLQEALEALGFGAYLLEVRRIQNEIAQLVNQRVEALSVRPKMQTREVKLAVSAAMHNLFRRIELADLENTALDYDSLINELNVWTMPYQALVKSRDTRSSNKTELNIVDTEKKTVALSPTTSATA